MKTRRSVAALLSVLLLLGCSRPASDRAQARAPATPAPEPVTFVNRVWTVAESTGMTPGQMVVFLSDGTLMFASPNARPALGAWRRDREGLTMIEEGIPYKSDILALSRTEFRIRSHNPGGFVDTRFVPAPTPASTPLDAPKREP